MPQLIPGARYSVTLEGTATRSGFINVGPVAGGPLYVDPAVIAHAKNVSKLSDPSPGFAPGDVVVFTKPDGSEVTLARGATGWPSDSGTLSDAEVGASYRFIARASSHSRK